MLIAGFLLLPLFYSPRFFPVHTVRIYGEASLDQAAIKAIVSPFLQRGFFGVQVDEVRDSLLQQPWLASARVRRIWPDQLEAVISKKVAIVQWNRSDFLSNAGELFTPEQSTGGLSPLPQLEGPPGTQQIMLNYFNQINRLFDPLHVKIIHLVLSPYQDLEVTLENGLLLKAGHKDCLARIARFVRVYPKIIGNNSARVESVDLRYPNGCAVQWKKHNDKKNA